MKRARASLAGALVLFVATSAHAHRVDEYLQETLIELTSERIVLYVELTPGIEVAPTVISSVDTDGDGVLSDAEKSAYTENVRRDLTLTVNDVPTAIRRVEETYPTVDAMTRGIGAMALTFEAALPSNSGMVTLQLENHHDATVASYLVNCLMPRSPDIHVLRQTRSHDQKQYRADLSFATPSKTWEAPRGALFSIASMTVVAVAGLFVWTRKRPSVRA